jgi:hypothetical protein
LESLFTSEDKGMCEFLSLHGALHLDPELLHGSNGQFSVLQLCLRLQLLIDSLPCFMTLFQGYLPLHSPLLMLFPLVDKHQH